MATIRSRTTLLTPPYGRRIILAGLFGLFALVFWLTIKSQKIILEPRTLVIDDQYLSFGDVWETPAFVWTLPIHNTTNEDIEVIDFMANCSCGTIEPRSFNIPAHETKEVALTLNLHVPHRESSPTRGPHPFTVTVIPVLRTGLDRRGGWQIHGRVRIPAELVPSRLSFEYLEKQPPPSLSQVVNVKCTAPCEKMIPECDANLANVQVSKGAQLSDGFNLKVEPSRQLKVGTHRFAIRLRFLMADTQEYTSVDIPVSVEVKSEYYLVPSLPNWGALKRGQQATEFIQLRSRSGKSFSVIKTSCESPNVNVMPSEPKHSSSHIYRVDCRFSEPGQHIDHVDFFVKEDANPTDRGSEVQSIRLRIKCHVFSD